MNLRRNPWRYLWALPNSILGLALGLLSFRLPRVEEGILLFEGPPRGFLWILSRMRRTAVTFGHVVLTAVPLRGAIRRHELAHVRQYERLGPAFIPVYVGMWLVRGYRRHPLELAAWRAESQS
ncbi:MAG: hypothetical protein ACRDIX_02230 [Actinomycetota bacterium]